MELKTNYNLAKVVVPFKGDFYKHSINLENIDTENVLFPDEYNPILLEKGLCRDELQDFSTVKDQIYSLNSWELEKIRKRFVNRLTEEEVKDYVKKYWNIETIPEEGNFIKEIFQGEEYRNLIEDGYQATMKSSDKVKNWIKTKDKGWGVILVDDKEGYEHQFEITNNMKFKDDHSNHSFSCIMVSVEHIIKKGWVYFLGSMEKVNRKM